MSAATDSVRVTATLLGTGTSTGVPVVGCRCAVCTSHDPHDERLRTSALLTVETGQSPVPLRILIDAGPDFRRQALRIGLDRLDAVLVTHHHYDHVAGLDDLRPFLFDNKTPIPIYVSPTSAAALQQAYPYAFVDGEERYPGAPRLSLREVDEQPFVVVGRYETGASVRVTPIPLLHGELPILGFRIGATAYLTDVSRISDASYRLVAGVDTLVVSALRSEPHRMHFTFDQAIAAAQRIGARQTFFTHVSHNTSHADIARLTPPGIAPGYDGLVLTDGGCTTAASGG